MTTEHILLLITYLMRRVALFAVLCDLKIKSVSVTFLLGNH